MCRRSDADIYVLALTAYFQCAAVLSFSIHAQQTEIAFVESAIALP
jgi:hypothetical protein